MNKKQFTEKLAQHIEACTPFGVSSFDNLTSGLYSKESDENLIHTIEHGVHVCNITFSGATNEVFIEINGYEVFFMELVPHKGFKIIDFITDIKKYTTSQLFTLVTMKTYILLHK